MRPPTITVAKGRCESEAIPCDMAAGSSPVPRRRTYAGLTHAVRATEPSAADSAPVESPDRSRLIGSDPDCRRGCRLSGPPSAISVRMPSPFPVEIQFRRKRGAPREMCCNRRAPRTRTLGRRIVFRQQVEAGIQGVHLQQSPQNVNHLEIIVRKGPQRGSIPERHRRLQKQFRHSSWRPPKQRQRTTNLVAAKRRQLNVPVPISARAVRIWISIAEPSPNLEDSWRMRTASPVAAATISLNCRPAYCRVPKAQRAFRIGQFASGNLQYQMGKRRRCAPAEELSFDDRQVRPLGALSTKVEVDILAKTEFYVRPRCSCAHRRPSPVQQRTLGKESSILQH